MNDEALIDHAQKQMIIGKEEYIRDMRHDVTARGGELSQFEIEEVEMAFERAFTLGFSLALDLKSETTGRLN